MSDRRKPIPFEPNRSSDKSAGSARGTTGTAAIPKAVANRMARRGAVFTGLPTMASRGGFVGSYGVLSASWEPENGSLLGMENISTNIQRMRESIRAQKQDKSR